MARDPTPANKPALYLHRLWARAHEHRLGAGSGALLTVLAGVILLIGTAPPPPGAIESRFSQPILDSSFDLPFVLRATRGTEPPKDVVIVYLDPDSEKGLKQSPDRPWDRSLHAKLLNRLTEEKAAAVVFDIVFAEAGENQIADEELIQAIQRNKRVILGGNVLSLDTVTGPGQHILPPFESFIEAGARWGLVMLRIESNRTVRQHHHAISDTFPSLSWAAAEFLRLPITRVPGANQETRWLNYYGPAGRLPNCNYVDALLPDGVRPGFFRNKIVFVGAKPTLGFAGTALDELRTPYTSWFGTASTGVEVHATSFLNLLREDWLTRLERITELCLVIIVGLVFGFGLTLFRPVPAILLALTASVMTAAIACVIVWHMHYWFAWLIVVIQIAIACAFSLGFNTIRWYLKEQLLMQSLSVHLSPARAKEIMRSPKILEPGAELQELSILFSDIANFSRISEKLPPRELAILLNSYFETSITSIHQTEGTVVKLIGDAIFAIWNAPVAQSDHHELACRAALLLRQQLLYFDEKHKDMPQLRTRVGIHTGVANVGNFGSTKRFDYTAIGDSINLSSRLEGLNKFLDTDILLTEELVTAVKGKFTTRSVGIFRFKGFERSVQVFELVSEASLELETITWRESFAAALKDFQQKNFADAKKKFIQTVELRPNDGPSWFYLQQIVEFESEPPTEGWAGEIELKEK